MKSQYESPCYIPGDYSSFSPAHRLESLPSFDMPMELPPGINEESKDLLNDLPYEFVTQVSSDERRLADLRERAANFLRQNDAKVLADDRLRKDPFAGGFVERQNEAARRRNEGLVLRTRQQALELKTQMATSRERFYEQKQEFAEKVSEMVPVWQHERVKQAENDLQKEREKLERLRMMQEQASSEQAALGKVRQQQQALHTEVVNMQKELQLSLDERNSPIIEEKKTVFRTPAFLGKGRRSSQPNSYEDGSSPNENINFNLPVPKVSNSQQTSPMVSARNLLSIDHSKAPSKMSSLQSTPRGNNNNEPSQQPSAVPSHRSGSGSAVPMPAASNNSVADPVSARGSVDICVSISEEGGSVGMGLDSRATPRELEVVCAESSGSVAHEASVNNDAQGHQQPPSSTVYDAQKATEEAEDDSVCRAVLLVFFAVVQHAKPDVDQDYLRDLETALVHWDLEDALEKVTTHPLVSQSIDSNENLTAQQRISFLAETGLLAGQVHAMALEFLRRYCGFPDRPFPLAVAASASASSKLQSGMTPTQFAVWKVVAAHLRWLATRSLSLSTEMLVRWMSPILAPHAMPGSPGNHARSSAAAAVRAALMAPSDDIDQLLSPSAQKVPMPKPFKVRRRNRGVEDSSDSDIADSPAAQNALTMAIPSDGFFSKAKSAVGNGFKNFGDWIGKLCKNRPKDSDD
eukprot:gene1084-1021_t